MRKSGRSRVATTGFVARPRTGHRWTGHVWGKCGKVAHMADRGTKRPTVSVPDDWPAHPDLTLALNGMGGFDWDLDSGRMHMDGSALESST